MMLCISKLCTNSICSVHDVVVCLHPCVCRARCGVCMRCHAVFALTPSHKFCLHVHCSAMLAEALHSVADILNQVRNTCQSVLKREICHALTFFPHARIGAGHVINQVSDQHSLCTPAFSSMISLFYFPQLTTHCSTRFLMRWT